MNIRIASAAVVVAMLLGAGLTGVASASSTPAKSGPARQVPVRQIRGLILKVEAIAATGQLPAKFSCARGSADLTRISNIEAKISALLAKGELREVKATNAGETLRAEIITELINEGKTLDVALGKVAGLITAACPA